MTLAEKLLWKELRNNQLMGLHFRRQQVIDGFIVDFYCHKSAFAVELDGEIHDQQRDYDQERDKILAFRGIRTLRLKNEKIVTDIYKTLLKIAEACMAKSI